MHSTTVKVRGYHLDLYGHVNNARYLEFLEEARWQLLEKNCDLGALQAQGMGFVAVKIVINYRRPALLGDRLEIRSHVATLGTKSGVLHQDVVLAGAEESTVSGGEPDTGGCEPIRPRSDQGKREPGELIADADVTFVVYDTRQQRAIPIAGEIRELFHAHTA
jgi:thioesterase-3